MSPVAPAVEFEAVLNRRLIPSKDIIGERLAYLYAEARVLKKLLKLAEELPEVVPPPLVPTPVRTRSS